jgi:outer membrane protein assembly factor BamA
MKDPLKTGYAERLTAAQEAKKALVAKLKPKPMVAAPVFESREAIKARELAAVRQARAEAKEAARLAALANEEAQLEAKRGERRERKALTKAEEKARRDAKYAARKARQR